VAERTLIARVREDEANPQTLVVTSPAVGLADLALRPGVFLNRYDRLLTMLVLGRRHVVRLPRDVQGWVVESFVGNELTPMAYGAPILRLDPRTAEDPGMGEPARGGDRETSGGADDASGSIVVKAPTEGIFYRKASPDSPPFVALGTIVTTGTVLGMVEVMKCFNQIAYGGPGLPESGEVTGILVEDAAEVQFEQPLFRIKPSIA
jgi:biotin carboxyl carrier protein